MKNASIGWKTKIPERKEKKLNQRCSVVLLYNRIPLQQTSFTNNNNNSNKDQINNNREMEKTVGTCYKDRRKIIQD